MRLGCRDGGWAGNGSERLLRPHVDKLPNHDGKVAVYTVPTDAPEADGTFSWDSTTMVLVSLEAGGKAGLGYTYADAATGKLVESLLEKVVHGRDVFDHGAILQAMYHAGPQFG